MVKNESFQQGNEKGRKEGKNETLQGQEFGVTFQQRKKIT